MKVYKALRTLLDDENHLKLTAGTYVVTDRENWVKRFGPDLELTSLSPDRVEGKSFTLKKCVEDLKLETKVEPEPVVEEEPTADEIVEALASMETEEVAEEPAPEPEPEPVVEEPKEEKPAPAPKRRVTRKRTPRKKIESQGSE